MRSLVPIAALLVGCSASGKYDAASDASSAPSPTTSGDDDDDGTTTPIPTEGPRWRTLEGVVQVAAGALDPAGTLLGASYYLDDLTQLCEAEWAVEAVASPPAPEGEPLLVWWELTLGPASGTCPGHVAQPLSITFGLGAYDPRLDVALTAHGLDGADGYGLYVADPASDEVWIVGVAGTTEQLAGRAGPSAEPPLADGEYELVPLILAPCCD